MTTWGQALAGDTVRGADMRGWVVRERGPVRRWVNGGDDARFALRLGEREVTAWRRLDDGADVMARGGHDELSRAADVLLGAGFGIEILEDALSDDPFTPATGTAEPKMDRWNRYLLPHPDTGIQQAWTRVSTVARTLADEYNLTLWKQRMVAKGLALRPDLVAGAAAADPDEDKSTLDGIAQQALDAAEGRRGANLGTALHTFTQRLDSGEPLKSLKCPPPLHGDLAAYLDSYKAARLKVEQVERIVCLPEFNVCGKFDRIVRQPPGDTKSEPLSVLDLKTGKDLSYGWLEIAIQQAMYAHAAWMWNAATRAWEPMPAVDQARALVLHLPVGKATAQLYGVNILEGWRLAQVALEVRAARSGAKSLAWLVEPDDPVAVAIHNVSRAGSREELAALWEQLNKRGLWTEEVNAAAMARHAQLQQQPVTV